MIEEEEDFNTRGAFLTKKEYFAQEKIKTHIRKLADAYKRADYVPPLIVKVVDGRVLVRDGHCRLRAIKLAISEGAEITRVRVEEQPGDEAAQTLLIVTSNDGAPLSVLERAVVFGRLKGFGWDVKKIATHVGVTTNNVRAGLSMLEMPIELKQLIQREQVSATYALELFTEHGTKAVQVIKDELAEQEAAKKAKGGEGANKDEDKKVKVTKKKLTKEPRMSKQVISDMRTSFVALSSDLDKAKKTDTGTYLLEVSEETLELLSKLKESISSTDDAEPEKNPNQLDLV
ncbi:chromosome partitioning protein ParB [Comamonas testosteroni]|uniref:Chromosome partitioning protein ParB n=1 Tax=Comamonas testosteroni TaxID=285 RepID=A0A373FB27_COMTE|nr:chromosome partitioning protein ParB [Comamonas testosteroni]